MIQPLKQLSQSHFIRSVVIVATGTAGSQAITMAFAPVITRLYGPEAFGLLGIFMAILAVLAPMAALTYPIAIVLPKQDSDARGLAKLSLLLAALSSSLALLLILIWGDWIAEQLGARAISQYMWLIPFAMLFSAFHQVMEQSLVRHRQFRITARVAVFQSALLNSAKVGAGLMLPMAGMLIILQTTASGMHALLLWLGMRNTTKRSCASEKTASLKQLALRHSDFPAYRAPQILINAISQSLPVIILASLFSPSAAGIYTLSYMTMSVPGTLIGKAVGDVLYPKMIETTRRKESLTALIIRPTVALLLIGAIPFGAIMVSGPWIFEFIFGSDWHAAGQHAQWLALFFLFNFANKPSVTAAPVLGIQSGLLIYEIFSTSIKTLGLLIGFYFFNNETVAIAIFSATGAVAYCTMILWIILQARRYENGQTSR